MADKHPTSARKDAHLDLAKHQWPHGAESRHPLDNIDLPYNALPELNLSDTDISVRFLGRRLAMPVMITGMTGGTDRSNKINSALVAVARDAGIAVGLGSQRASLEAGQSQKTLRKQAGNTILIGNIGAAQLVQPQGMELARRAVDDLEADALAIHLNPLQELVQPEGDHSWAGISSAIERAVSRLPCPVLIKEVGAGLSGDVVTRLYGLGVRHVDLAARGGTNWALIEASRQTAQNQQLYAPFLSMGIDLPCAITAARTACPDMQLIASGGIRHGLDMAKCLWLGADMAGIAGAVISQLEDEEGRLQQDRLAGWLQMSKDQIRLSLFLTGARTVSQLKILKTETKSVC